MFTLDFAINAISLGSLYALISLGLVIVYGILKLVNYAYGELIMIAGYSLYLLGGAGVSPWIVLAIAAVLTAILTSYLTELVAFRPVRTKSMTAILVTSFAVSTLLQNLVLLIVSPRSRAVPLPEFFSKTVNILGSNVSMRNILTIVISLALLGALSLLMKHTVLGIALRAAAENFTMTRMLGVPANMVISVAFILSGFLAGVVALFWVARSASVTPTIGIAPLVAAVLGYPLMRLSDAAAVITMFGMLVIIHVVLVHWSQVTNGPRTLFGIDNLTTYWVAVIFAILAVILAYWFRESALGLKLRASRDDRYAAGSIGINIVIVRWLGFILSAFIAGFAGGLWAHFITSFSPSAFYLAETFTILAMLVVGGTGSVTGAVVGTFSVTLVREALRALENGINSSATSSIEVFGLTEVALSIALILILILRPGGVFGSQEARWANGKTLPAEENGASSGN